MASCLYPDFLEVDSSISLSTFPFPKAFCSGTARLLHLALRPPGSRQRLAGLEGGSGGGGLGLRAPSVWAGHKLGAWAPGALGPSLRSGHAPSGAGEGKASMWDATGHSQLVALLPSARSSPVSAAPGHTLWLTLTR